METDAQLSTSAPDSDKRSTLSDFEIMAKVGEGSYSSVWKVKRR